MAFYGSEDKGHGWYRVARFLRIADLRKWVKGNPRKRVMPANKYLQNKARRQMSEFGNDTTQVRDTREQ